MARNPRLQSITEFMELATAQVDTLRIKLRKLAAVVTCNVRRIRLYLASNWRSVDVFVHAIAQLRSP